MDFGDMDKSPIMYTYAYLKSKNLASRKVDRISF